MYKYDIIREEIIPGSLEDFRALMHEIYELQPQFREDSIFLQGERTPPDYPENVGRWEVTLGGTLQQRGFILARQLPNGTTKLQFAYHSKFQPIGPQFDIEFINYIMKQDTLMNSNADILIITVTRVESRAVVDVFKKVAGQVAKATPIDDRVYHDLSVVNGARVFMVQSEMGSGGLGASHQTVQKGITALSPTMVIMVGIAFGVNADKQSIGDVLVSRQLMLYELQRVGTEEDKPKLIPRGDRPHASPRLINLFRSADLHWDESKAEVYFGLILSGEKLVDNIDFQQQLREFEPEAIGGEMEGAGLYVACQDAKVDWILVKSICDWADGHKGQNKDTQQRLAAHNAASFVVHVLQHAPPLRTPVLQDFPGESLYKDRDRNVPESRNPSSNFGDRLIKILSEMIALHDDGNRKRLLHRLPPEPVSAIARYPASGADLYSIVESAAGWGKLDSGEWPLVVIAQNALSLAKGTQPGRKLEALLAELDRTPPTTSSSIYGKSQRARTPSSVEPPPPPSLNSVILEAREAVLNSRPDVASRIRDYMAFLTNKIDAIAPDFSERDNLDELLVQAIDKSTVLVIEFSQIAKIIAEVNSYDAALALYKGFEDILNKYDLPVGFSGHYGPTDFDFYKFIGHELFVSFVSFLLRERRWEVITAILDEDIYVRNRPNFRIVSFDYISDYVELIGYKSKYVGLKSIIGHAEILNKRHTTGNLSEVLPFNEFVDTDFFLFLRSEDWWPWSTFYLRRDIPRFLLESTRERYAANLLHPLAVEDIQSLRKRVIERMETWKSWETGMRVNPIGTFNIDAIGSR